MHFFILMCLEGQNIDLVKHATIKSTQPTRSIHVILRKKDLLPSHTIQGFLLNDPGEQSQHQPSRSS